MCDGGPSEPFNLSMYKSLNMQNGSWTPFMNHPQTFKCPVWAKKTSCHRAILDFFAISEQPACSQAPQNVNMGKLNFSWYIYTADLEIFIHFILSFRFPDARQISPIRLRTAAFNRRRPANKAKTNPNLDSSSDHSHYLYISINS